MFGSPSVTTSSSPVGSRPEWSGIGYLIEGSDVYFSRRDITQCTDEEFDRIVAIVKSEVSREPGRKVESIEFESDFVDDTCKYVVTTRVSGAGDTVESDTNT